MSGSMVAAVKGVRCSVLGIAMGGIFKWYATLKNLRDFFQLYHLVKRYSLFVSALRVK